MLEYKISKLADKTKYISAKNTKEGINYLRKLLKEYQRILPKFWFFKLKKKIEDTTKEIIIKSDSSNTANIALLEVQ